jgi:hypothetical protein
MEEMHARQINQEFEKAEVLAQKVLWASWTEALARYIYYKYFFKTPLIPLRPCISHL